MAEERNESGRDMLQVADPSALRRWCDGQRAKGLSVALVPTMGYLHRGHLTLMQRARQLADRVVVSIFVNPTQFGPQEDLATYPRDMIGDLAKCQGQGVDLVFTPAADSVYLPGHQTFVTVDALSQGMCGEHRPGHFRGVCTVVMQLFNMVGSCVAVFGEKDYQQLQVIRRMVADLHVPVHVEGVPTVREEDGLALSSRNAYLSEADREAASGLYHVLCAVRDRSSEGGLKAQEVEAMIAKAVAEAGARLDYVEVRRRHSLKPLGDVVPGETVVLLAAFFGETRLIDNLEM